MERSLLMTYTLALLLGLVASPSEAANPACAARDQVRLEYDRVALEAAAARAAEGEVLANPVSTTDQRARQAALRAAGPDLSQPRGRLATAERVRGAEIAAADNELARLSTPVDVSAADRRIAEASAEESSYKAKQAAAMAEMRAGLYCSRCMRPKSQIEYGGHTTFERHLADVQGVAVPATEAQVAEAAAFWDDKIRSTQTAREAATRQRAAALAAREAEVSRQSQRRASAAAALEVARQEYAAAAAAIQSEHDGELRRLETEISTIESQYASLLESAGVAAADAERRAQAVGVLLQAAERSCVTAMAAAARVEVAARAAAMEAQRVAREKERKQVAARDAERRRRAAGTHAWNTWTNDAPRSGPALDWSGGSLPPVPGTAADEGAGLLTKLKKKARAWVDAQTSPLEALNLSERLRGLEPPSVPGSELAGAVEARLREELARAAYEAKPSARPWETLSAVEREDALYEFDLRTPTFSMAWVRAVRERAWALTGKAIDAVAGDQDDTNADGLLER